MNSNKNKKDLKTNNKIKNIVSKLVIAISIVFSGIFKIPKAFAKNSNFNQKENEIVFVEKIPIKIKLGKHSRFCVVEIEIKNEDAVSFYEEGILINKKKSTHVVIEPSSFVQVEKKEFFPEIKPNLMTPIDIINVNQSLLDIILKNEIEEREKFYSEIKLKPFTKNVKVSFGINCSVTESNIQVYKKKADKLIKENLFLIPDKNKK